MFRICVYLFCLFSIPVNGVFGQETGKPFSRHYGPREYHGNTQNWAVIQDSTGLIYIANQAGIIQYDGTEWSLIPNRNKSTVRSLALDKNGNIWVGAYGDMGYVNADKTGALVYNSLSSLVPSEYADFAEIWNIQPIGNEIYLLADNYLFKFFNNQFKTWKCQGEYFYTEMECQNHLVFQEIGNGLKCIINDTLVSIEGSGFFAQSRIHSFFNLGGDTILIGTRWHGLFTALLHFDGSHASLKQLKPIQGQLNDYLKNNSIYHGIILENGNFAFATIKGGVVIADKNFKILEIYSGQTAIGHEACYYIMQSQDKSLWVALDNGLARLEMNSPFRYWDNETGFKGTITDIKRHKRILYIATASGVFYLENKPGNYISTFSQVPGIEEQTWCLLEVYNLRHKNDTVLLASTSSNIYLIEKNKAMSVFENKSNYEIYRSNKNPLILYAGMRTGLQVLEFRNNRYKQKTKIESINYEVRGITEDLDGYIWASVSYKGIARIKFTDSSYYNYMIEFFDTSQGLYDIKQVMPTYLKNDLVFLSDSGIQSFDANRRKFIRYEGLGIKLSKLQFGRFSNDKYGNIYVNGNVVIKPTENGFIADSTPFRRIPAPESDVVFADDDGRVWIANPDGLFIYNPKNEQPSQMQFKTIIREVRLQNGTFLFKGHGKCEIPVIEHKDNSVTFKFSALFFDLENQTQYSCFLEGFDNSWSDFKTIARKEYTNLFEGEYVFKVKAKNVYGQISQTATYRFKIAPPWFRTPFAYVVYILIIVLAVRTFVKLRTRQIIKEKDRLEKIIEDRTAQINMQKEELLSQAEQLRAINSELEKLSIVVRETANAVTIFDNTGKFLWVNEGFTRMYGYTLEQFISEKCDNIFECNLPANIKKIIKGCIENKKTIIYDFFTTTRSGEGLWAQTTLTPVLNDLGETINLIAIDADITRLKDAEQEIFYQKDKIEKQTQLLELKNAELEKLSIVARETDNAIIIMDSKGNFEWVNEGFTRLYGYTIDQLINEKSHNIVGASSNLNIKDLINVWFGNKQPIMYESLNQTRDGRLIWAQTTLTPVLDRSGNLVKMVAIDTDITKLKEAQKQIEEQRNELEKANATKDKFFSIIAHDLRSPFASLLSLINILNDDFDNLDETQKKKYIGSVQDAAKRTFSLLENLLDWARIQKGNIKYNPVYIQMKEIVDETILLHSDSIKNKQLIVESRIPDNIQVFADENMLRTIVRNLVSNAIKFSFNSGKVEIGFMQNQHEYVFFVRDYGLGISDEDMQKLFRIDIHHTTPGTAREKGTGLGLVLCRDFIERNNGHIWIESEQGKGSTFFFSLPSAE